VVLGLFTKLKHVFNQFESVSSDTPSTNRFSTYSLNRKALFSTCPTQKNRNLCQMSQETQFLTENTKRIKTSNAKYTLVKLQTIAS